MSLRYNKKNITMATRQHVKPAVPKEALEAEKVARHMYASLTQVKAPKAHPRGYIMGACTVLKVLMDQAVQQGADKEELKQYAISFVEGL